MRDRWLTIIGRVSNRPSVAQEVYDDLMAHYTASDRRYHGWRHIEFCLRQLDSVRHLAMNADAIELAIWFHDVIYDTHRKDNEEASAAAAANALQRLGVATDLSSEVQRLILITRHDSPAVDNDAAMIVDIDLSILGQPTELFDEYEAEVRFEYGWVSDEDFRVGRAKVLSSFLSRPQIYKTDFFRDELESSARHNLSRSIATLSSS